MTLPSPAPTAVIVDGYSNARHLAAAFAERGCSLVHVLSSAGPRPGLVEPRPEDYAEWLVCPGESALPATLARLAELRPVAVVAGQEPGVPLADVLSERLGVATNGTALSAARRDKYRMTETMRAAGIRAAHQHRGAGVEEAVAWAEAAGGYPVVVKPPTSSSSDNVFICQSADEVARAARRILAARTMFSDPNTGVLVQSYLAGREFAIDSVSADGHVYTAAVWEYEKTLVDGGRRIYGLDILRDPQVAPVPEVIAYVGTVLEALGIRHGLSHTEVIVTPDGPTLVEVGARLNGAMQPGFCRDALGTDPASLAALAYTDPALFAARYGGGVYRPLKAAATYEAPTTLDGVVESVDEAVVDKIQALDSVGLVELRTGPGRRIRPTVDLLSCPMRVFLTAPDEARLRADRAEVDNLKDAVYRLRDHPEAEDAEDAEDPTEGSPAHG